MGSLDLICELKYSPLQNSPGVLKQLRDKISESHREQVLKERQEFIVIFKK